MVTFKTEAYLDFCGIGHAQVAGCRRLCFAIVLSCLSGHAQNESFASDRPGLSDAPDIIRKGTFQLESGLDISRYNRYNLYQLPVNTLRYAISSRFEARMDFTVVYDPIKRDYRANLPGLGVKTVLFRPSKKSPAVSLIAEIVPPLHSLESSGTGAGLELCVSHGIPGGDSVYYNGGLTWSDLTKAPMINGLLGYNTILDDQWQAFAEFYYYDSRLRPVNWVTDVGFTYQANKSLQWDLSFGLDVKKPKGNLYCEGGISYNFH